MEGADDTGAEGGGDNDLEERDKDIPNHDDHGVLDEGEEEGDGEQVDCQTEPEEETVGRGDGDLDHAGDESYIPVHDRGGPPHITEKTTFVVVDSEETGFRFACSVTDCGKSFKRKHTLNQHLATHAGHRSVKCEQCGKLFFSSSQKYKHKESCHKSYIYKCALCDKSFSNKHNLETHMKSHKQIVSQHNCEMCDSTFIHKSDLTKHMRTHSSAQAFICDICNKEFRYKNSLRRHEKIHLDERRHSCDKCDKNFIQKCDLLKHAMTHESPRFKCKECKQIFARRDSLIRHFRLHRPSLSCPVRECWDKFPSKASLLVHLRTDHNRLEVEPVMTSLTFLDRPEEEEDQEAVDNPEPLPEPGHHDILVDIETQALENAGIFVDKTCLFNLQDDLDAELTTGQALVNESVLQSIQRDRELEEHNFVIAE